MFRYQWNLQHADYADSDRYFYLNLEMHDHNTRCSKCSSTCKARTNIKQFSVYIDTYIDYIHSFILETYIAPLQETTTRRRSQPSHGQKRRTSERCKIWKGVPSARNAAQRGDHSMLMDPQPKRPFAA